MTPFLPMDLPSATPNLLAHALTLLVSVSIDYVYMHTSPLADFYPFVEILRIMSSMDKDSVTSFSHCKYFSCLVILK